jgi:hypothetical protein
MVDQGECYQYRISAAAPLQIGAGPGRSLPLLNNTTQRFATEPLSFDMILMWI